VVTERLDCTCCCVLLCTGALFRVLGLFVLLLNTHTLVFSMTPPNIMHNCVLYGLPIVSWCAWRVLRGPIPLVTPERAEHRAAHVYLSRAGATQTFWVAARCLALVALSCKVADAFGQPLTDLCALAYSYNIPHMLYLNSRAL
jgi:hypothetical protein